MSNVKKIIHKHSSVIDKLPRTDELDYGEIAINYASGKEFISLKNADNQIVKITPNIFERKPNQKGITLVEDVNSIAEKSSSISYGRNILNYGNYSIAFGNFYINKFSIEKIENNNITLTLTEKKNSNYKDFLKDCVLKVIGEDFQKTIKNVTINSENKVVLEVDNANDVDISKKYFLYFKYIGEKASHVISIGPNKIEDKLSFATGDFNIIQNENKIVLAGFNKINGNINKIYGIDNSLNVINGANNKIIGNENFENLIFGEDNEINSSNQCFTFIHGAKNKVLKNNNEEKDAIKFIIGKYSEAKSNCNEFIFGDFNSSNEDTLFVISNGENESSRHNALEVKKSGEIFIQKDKVNTSEMISLQDKLTSFQTKIDNLPDTADLLRRMTAMETQLAGMSDLLNRIIGDN